MCVYQFRDGKKCQLEDAGQGFCYWHDPTIDKSGENLAVRLEGVIKAGHCMEGASLKRANLEGINLVCHGRKENYSLARADLYRANLRNAHLFRIDLTEASLMKTDCREANMHFACLKKANLLGARLEGAKIENIEWGKQLLHEEKGIEAAKGKRIQESIDFFEQAEEICRNLRKVSELQGLFELAGHFFYEEMLMRRYQMPLWSFQRGVSKLVDVFCGYGEKPLRVILVSLSFISICGFFYFFLGISDHGQDLAFEPQQSFWANLMVLGKHMYFSVVTFTTLGYGDLVPVGSSRVVAAIEAFVGSFTLALFVVVFVKKMTR
ncbi:MAG: pentapeptide repeat-containing protein [Bermanella sp.]